MKLHCVAVVTFLNLAVVFVGCGQSREGYVDFEQTAPSELDSAGQPSPVSPAMSSESEKQSAGPSIPAMSGSDVTASEGSADQSNSPAKVSVAGAAPKNAGEAEAGAEKQPVKDGAVSAAVDTGEAVAGGDSKDSVASGDEMPTPDKKAESPEKPGVGELIVSSQSGLQGPADMPVVENSATSEPRKIELLIPNHHLRKERGTDAVRVTYDDIDLLKVLNMEPVPANAVEYFPDWLKSLDGRPVRIRGFMYPTFEASGLTRFTLARDNGICCFVRQPKIYDIIGIELADGITTDYIEGRPFDVEGIFHIDPMADEKDLSRLYRIDNARVLH